jgi:hypothetical protein
MLASDHLVLIDDDFHSITASTPLGNVPKWDFVSGSSTNLTFVAGTHQDIELSIGTGTGFGAHINAPDKIHQMIEVKFVFGTGLGSTAFTGGFCLYQDASNYVLIRCNQNTRVVTVVEVIAGTPETLVTSPAAAGDAVGGAIRLEIINHRARWWFQTDYRAVDDIPPDGAADLTGTYTEPGQWGVYGNSDNGTNTMRITRFTAKELPAAALPPPSLTVTEAQNLKLAPVTCGISGVSADAVQLEWDVKPADPDDFPEGYNDYTAASVTSRVLWMRPGYTYDVKVREFLKGGGANPWTTSQRIVVTGTKQAPSPFTLPNDEFPDVVPDAVLDRSQTAETGSSGTDDGRENFKASYIRPQNTFQLKFTNRTFDEIQQLIDFFDDMTGQQKSFKWVHPISGDQFAMRFTSDDYQLDPVDMNAEGDGAINNIGFDIAEVVEDSVGTLSISLTVDPSLL